MVSISRVSRDGRSAILKSSTGYDVFSLDSSETTNGEFQALVAAGSWRRPTKGDAEAFADLIALADGGIIASAESESTPRPRTYKAPKSVREEISAALMEFSALLSDSDRDTAKRIVSGPVGQEDIQWMHTFFSQVEKAQKLRGGQYGQRWAAKICSVQDPLTASVAPFDDDLFYYGLSDTEGSSHIQALIAVDPNTNALYDWEDGVFVYQEDEDLTDIDEPYILPLDGETAAAVAAWIDQQSSYDDDVADPSDEYNDEPYGYNVYDHNPEERNLFEMAAPEIDFDELARVAAIIAAGGVRTARPIIPKQGYTSAQRSANVAKQPRAPGGKFGSGKTAAPVTKAPKQPKLGAYAKANLTGIPNAALVANIHTLVMSWLHGTGPFAKAPRKPRKASTKPRKKRVSKGRKPRAVAKHPRGPKTAAQKQQAAQTRAANQAAKLRAIRGYSISSLTAAATGEAPINPPTDLPATPLYLAIVDNVDKNSVLDLVAIHANEEDGEPEAWVRKDGAWVEDPDYLAKIMGESPPAMKQIPDEEDAKTLCAQIDEHDQESAGPAPDSTSSSDQISSLAVGFALPDGSYPIYNAEQLFNAIDTMQAYEPDAFELAHVRKRALALNRMDLLPKEWRAATFLERGIVAAASSPLFGEYGEIVAAGSLKGHVDGTARLKAYWAYGKGALKIRWGTPGDLTRAHRHLAKYVGDAEAWGMAQNLHKMVFGVSNIVHDRATGQYESHGRGRK